MRSGPGRPKRHGVRNPAGSKVARRIVDNAGHDWHGEIYYTGELTKLNKARALKRLELS